MATVVVLVVVVVVVGLSVVVVGDDGLKDVRFPASILNSGSTSDKTTASCEVSVVVSGNFHTLDTTGAVNGRKKG